MTIERIRTTYPVPRSQIEVVRGVADGARRIEICGGIASGKTTLASALQDANLECHLEDYRANPFWEEFCKTPVVLAFETEISFLMQHYWQMRKPEVMAVVHDTSLIQDIAYADVNLAGRELALFRELHAYVSESLGPPKLVVHLICPANGLLRRIIARRRQEEQSLKLDYLERLNEAIAERVRRAATSMRVLSIDSAALDFASNATDRRRAIELVHEAIDPS